MLVSFGGNGRSAGFAGVATDMGKRKKFLNRLVSFMDEHDLDGVDYNWEYPRNNAEWRGWANLLAQTKTLFKEKNRLVTIAYYPDGAQERTFASIGDKSGKKGFLHYVDMAHSMAYDNCKPRGGCGQHSTFQFAEATIRLWGQSGLHSKKLTLGVPFYARHIVTGDWKTYEELLKSKRAKTGDPNARYKENLVQNLADPDSTRRDYYFNSPDSIRDKIRLAKAHNLRGVMIWELGQDVHPTDSESLLLAITEAKADPARKSLDPDQHYKNYHPTHEL